MSADPDRAGWPAGFGRIVLDEVDSTSSEAARRAGDLIAPTWILAHRQSAARGRRGRPWISAPGNFAATLVMHPEGTPAAAALRSFTAALALAETLDGFLAGRGVVGLKWPNDVLLNGGKVAGILLESAGQGARVAYLAIGIGVNLAAAPPAAALEPGASAPVSVAGETGVRIAPVAFLDRLAAAFARWETVLARDGFAPVRTAWLARAARLGEVITARTFAETCQGRFDTIADDGALVLVTPSGKRHIAAAEVYF
ncbi:MAG: biotin--[acetyl-CoA-carboxylase] ligase [Defluviimonas sp.]|uniref:biotin--[acetyl-CoA-carboxylase] ligase n=1 Tax=Albidovulum sp. TaxID=1872424 RepID=UPI001D36A9FA|nr:biotin--[acetyl-CoA-carboxylase] ligase [Paracoccaceae bacterium]MCC0064812.1 biotin--[acetyl-CoA-carboxylase] ligase [Defluviimonas sp.]